MRSTCTAFVLLLKILQCTTSDDSFQLTNIAGFCLVKMDSMCQDIRWTTGQRLLVPRKNKCLGVQGKTVGSEVSLYDCDETSDLQRWECKNETVLALQGQHLYVELKADNTAILSKTAGPNSRLTISGTSSGACTRTHRELFTIAGNAAGRPCMFPFLYENQWYSSCTVTNSKDNQLWCAVETKYEHETWGYCPMNRKDHWRKHPTSGAVYQLNTDSALTWLEADRSCKQQSASLVSITDPHEQAYITALLEARGTNQGYKLWTGLTLDAEHGWKWSNGNPFRYLNWDSAKVPKIYFGMSKEPLAAPESQVADPWSTHSLSVETYGHPFTNPSYSCGMMDGAVRYAWQSVKCNKRLGYICYSKGVLPSPTEGLDVGFCPTPWIPYNGHCFQLKRTAKSWSDALLACRKEGGDLVSIRNMEDQSFLIVQLGYASTDELWIGFNDRKTEGLFDWTDHTPVSFTSWEFGRPAVVATQEDCVLIRGESGNWADRDCKEKHGFICMKSSASEPSGDEVQQNPGCKTGWKRYGSYCYFIGTEKKTFEEAKEDCERSKSYLTDVSTRVDNAFLVSLVGLRSEKYFWLGLSNQKNQEVFEWTNSVRVRYTHWNRKMPDHNQGCVAMATGSSVGLWDVLPCTNREKYICKHLAEGATVTSPPPTVSSVQCTDGWNKVMTRNVCYKVYTGYSDTKTWFEARDYCRAIGGDLISFHSAAEQQIQQARRRKVWIGLSTPDQGTSYVWNDGTPVNFQHWKDGEPNNINNVESCVEFYPNDYLHLDERGSWNDNQCETYNGWICQIPTGVTPKPPPPPVTPDYNHTSDGWLEWGTNQYFIQTQSMANEDARKSCKEKHADLVTIDSEAERVFLWKQISKRFGSFWIGLTVDLDKSFQWMDGSPVIFQMWDVGQPNFHNSDENCVVMRSFHGFWHDYNCGYEFQSICKRSGSPHVNATLAPTVPPKGGCKQGWKKINFKCYKIVNNQNLTWYEARQQCKDMGGNLASIPSRHVQVFLLSEMVNRPTIDLWIGFHNSYRDGFFWTDGRSKSYVNLQLSESVIFPHISHFSYHERLMVPIDEYDFRQRFGTMCAVINTDPSLGIGKWIPKSCNDTNGFICLKDFEPGTDPTEPTTSNSYVKILNDSIKLVPEQMSWDTAQKHCEADGAKLASVRTEWTQVYIELLALNLKQPLWLGLNKSQTNNYFRYISGWPMTFTHWGDNEPRRDGICVYMDVDGKWKSNDCKQNISSVCMKSTDTPPKDESKDYPGVCPEDPDPINPWQRYIWKPFRGFCYIFFTEQKEWQDAATSCVAHGGTLVSIADPFEQEFIKSNIETYKDRETSYWMGLFKTHKGEWMWLDKTVMDYSNWQRGRPNYRSYGLIKVSDGTWSTGNRWNDKPYICKTAKVLQATTSPTPNVGKIDQIRGHTALTAVLIIAGIAAGLGIAFFLFKKSSHHMPTMPVFAFDNPHFYNNQSTLVDSKKLVGNADDDDTQPVITI